MIELLDGANLALLPALIGSVAGTSAAGAGGAGFLGSIGNFLGSKTFGNVLGALGGLFGSNASAKALKQGRSDILGLPGMDGPQMFQTGFGSTGRFGLNSPLLSGNLQNLSSAAQPLLEGGLFNAPGLQNALQGLNLSGALSQAQGAFGQQIDPTGTVGGLQGLAGQAGLFTSPLMAAGAGNQLAAGDQSGLQAQELDALRAAAAPQQNRMFNQLQDRLFAQGRLGSTGGSENLRAFFEAQNQQDLGFQTEAFNRALGRGQFLGNLGAQQFGQGLGASQAAGGFLNQALGAGIQGLGFNQQGALQNLQAQQGLFGFGGDLMASQFGLGLGALDTFGGLGALGVSAGRAPFEIQASLLGAGGQHADALSRIATAKRGGGFLGGLFSDRRLKDNLYKVGTRDGISWYTWDWNDKAFEVGASNQPSFGVIADEVEQVMPEAVFEVNGYKAVNYDMILGDD